MENLSPVEVRVLGALLEKDIATPEYYPLTVNSLQNACNQKSSRDPVVDYDESTVERALELLQTKGFVVRISGAGHRVEKYGHRLGELLNLGRRELAVICVLMLRGPQTVGELRGRTERMHSFVDLEEIERVLESLEQRDPDPLVAPVARGRWIQLLSEGESAPIAKAAPVPAPAPAPARPSPSHAPRRRVEVRRVDECETLHDLITHCFPAFGGAFLRRIYTILDQAIGMGCPLTLAIAGPVTVSGQHQAWLIPLLETGWIAYLSTTDAVCYHDGHRSLDAHRNGPIFEVPIFGDDGALRDERTIRVTDMAFDEDVLLDQDRYIGALLQLPEFQHSMTGTELRHRLGRHYADGEQRGRLAPGLLATCHRMAIPVFVGAPSDGSVFLNSMKLWAMKQASLIPSYGFDLDLHAEVFEACAYHRWGLFDNPPRALATWMFGGGVPKNFNLQPEPALGQVLGIPNVRGYNFDVQIVTAPVTDGSLSSCPPAEAVTWGKVDKDTYQQATESMQADYSTVAPFLVKALLDNRRAYENRASRIGEDRLFHEEPKARGYLRPRSGYRLFDNRDELTKRLTEDVRANRDWLMESIRYAQV